MVRKRKGLSMYAYTTSSVIWYIQGMYILTIMRSFNTLITHYTTDIFISIRFQHFIVHDHHVLESLPLSELTFVHGATN
jgi:hypothetical protein